MNLKMDLSGIWKMRCTKEKDWLDAQVPGSVYSNLLRTGKMEDPYFRENQYEAREISRNDFEFSREFDAPKDLLAQDRLFLQFDGLDTLADIYINDLLLGSADNMHRIWKYDVTGRIHETGNLLRVVFHSPITAIERMQEKRPLWGVATTIPGYPYLRKAHYMFGWDWGPQLPDMGIWRAVSLWGVGGARLEGVFVKQTHTAGTVALDIGIDTERFSARCLEVRLVLTDPQGNLVQKKTAAVDDTASIQLLVEKPQLWWPNGWGEHPLYTLETTLLADGLEVDGDTRRIGLRTITVSRENDTWGQEFCFVVNGQKIFAMGADYIPEDQIIAKCSPRKTEVLLRNCTEANFNHIRVWGGGYYPEDYFYDLCDELGLMVWQDFMFACAVYRMDKRFTENIRMEIIENIKRIRGHASLALWCGNNEMETAWDSWGIPQDADLREDYQYQFEQLIPDLCAQYDPQTFYWPSSPSSGGGFDDPNSYSRGDVHYWDVWHGMKPLTEFRNFYFRFCSEYGFMSLPSEKTVNDFALPEDKNLFSAVMEAHQKCDDGTKKLLYYMSQMVPYPYSFQGVIYATQLMQADAIRANVEHMRRHRGRCMGSTYWQVNDSNPIISWSSIDYNGRWKALHYYAKRFYAPVLLSADETDPQAVSLWLCNEQRGEVRGTVHWTLRDRSANVLRNGENDVRAEPLSALRCLVLDLSQELPDADTQREKYLEYRFVDESGCVRSKGSSLFVKPKHFRFLKPEIHMEIAEEASSFLIMLSADVFAKSVCLDLREADCKFSDNWFDIHGGEPISVTVDKDTLSMPLSLEGLREQLTVFCNNDL